MDRLRCVQLLVLVAMCSIAAHGQAHAAAPKKGVWRGEVTMRASASTCCGGYTYSFRAVFPGRWVRGSARTRWIGTLRWTLEDRYVDPGDPTLQCVTTGAGKWPVELLIYEKLLDRGREIVEVDFFDEPRAKFGPVSVSVTRACGGPPTKLDHAEAMAYLPRIGPMFFSIKKATRSFVRTIRPVFMFSEHRRFPVRFAFVKKPR